jgi:WD40 repeat protein
MAFNFLKSLDADDIFISYSRDDGSAYLTGLDAALSAKGFSCFTDKRGTDANRLPPKTLFRKIRTCKTLVLLATPGALKSPENIAPEISEFAEANGTSKIVCVSFDQGAEFANWSSTPWYTYVEGKARERENANALKTGEPSPSVVETIVTASDYMKSKDRLRKYRNRTIMVLATLVLASIGAAILATIMFKRAATQTIRAAAASTRAAEATQAAQKALLQAIDAQGDALTAKLGAEIAKADATEQKRLADDATVKAQAAEARATSEQARAEKQGALADSRSFANHSQTLLRQGPDDLPNSVSLAVAAVRKSHTVEADTALRDSLAVLPHLRSSYKFAGHNAGVNVALSPDGKHFAILSSDHKLRIYESDKLRSNKTGGQIPIEQQTALKQFDCDCQEFALSSGLAYAAAVTAEGIRIIDLKRDTGSHLLKLVDGAADKVALSPGGRYLALYFNEGEDLGTLSKVRVLEAASGKVIKAFDDLNMRVKDIAFGPTGNLALGGEFTSLSGGRFRGRVLRWSLAAEVPDGKTEPELTEASFPEPEIIPEQGAVDAVAPGLDNTSFATDLGIWKRLSGRMDYDSLARLPYLHDFPSDSFIEKMAFGPDGRSVTLVRSISARDQNDNDRDEQDLEVWDTTGHRDLAQAFLTKEVYSVSIKPGAQLIYTLTGQPTSEEPARVFQVDGKELEGITFEPGSEEKDLDHFKPTDGYIVKTEGQSAVVWDVWGRRKIKAEFGDSLEKVGQATVSPGGRFLALSGPDKKDKNWVIVYRLNGDSYRKWKSILHEDEIVEMSLSADGQRLALLDVRDFGVASVVDVSSGRDVSPEILEKTDVSVMTLSPRGRYLVIMDSDNKSQLLDLSRGRKAKPLSLLDNTKIESLAFSRDDRYLGLGSDDGTLHVFDTKPSEGVIEIARLPHTGKLTAVAFSDDDRYIATASSDPHPNRIDEEESYPVRIWLLQPADLVTEATTRLKSLRAPVP